MDDYIDFKIPGSISTGYRSNDTKCVLNKEHKMGTQRRSCDEYEDCPYKYKILKCEICNWFRIPGTDEHNHDLKYEYDNLNGLHQRIKYIILELMDKGTTQPKHIHIFLTKNQEQYKGSGVPKLPQVQGFVLRSKPTFKTWNLIKCVADLILINQFSIDNIRNPKITFVFGTKLDANGKPIIGTGSDASHLNILMTSMAFLYRLDTSDQGNVALFHIDGTYRMTKLKFPLVIFGRIVIKRRFHPIIYFLTSHEQEIDFTYFYVELRAFLEKLQGEYNINICFVFTYLIQDACLASYNAVNAVYPHVYVLMCWYHLKARVDILPML